jgi:hypothetical protein
VAALAIFYPFQNVGRGDYDVSDLSDSGADMRRRQFIGLLGGAAVTWPLAAHAQQGERPRRIGLLLPATHDDSEYPSLLTAFVQALQQMGWTDGRNMQLETRWAGGGAEANRKYAAELVAWKPDVLVGAGNSSAGPLLQATRSIPIVFTIVPDPVGAGLVDSLARPGGNATGFAQLRIRHRRQVAGAAQGGRTARDACGGAARFRVHSRNRSMERDSDRCAVARHGGQSDQHA